MIKFLLLKMINFIISLGQNGK